MKMATSAPLHTQPRRFSLREYFWVIVFKYDVHTENPFYILNLNGLKCSHFPHFLVCEISSKEYSGSIQLIIQNWFHPESQN